MNVHSSVGTSYNFRFREVCAFRNLFLIIARGVFEYEWDVERLAIQIKGEL
jgi:hypothetical protein